MPRPRSSALLLLSLLSLGLCPPAQAEVLDRVAAVVNQEVVTLRELKRMAAPALAALQGIGNPTLAAQEEQRVLRSTLDELVGQVLLLQEAEKLQVTATPAEVQEYLEGVKRQYSWDDAAMAAALAQEGSSVDEFRRDVRRRLSTSRLIQMKLGPTVRVSEEEVTQALEREYAGLAVEEERTARHILFLVPEGASPEQEAQAKAKAESVLTELRAPGADFGALARAHSEGPSAPEGGEIGSFTKGMLDPAFEAAAFKAEVGAIVGPVRTRYGYHLLQITRSRELQPKDEEALRNEVRARLRQQAMEREMKRWVQDLRRKAFVDVKLWAEK